MINAKSLQDKMSIIMRDWMDESVVAKSYADYISSKSSIATGIRNDVILISTTLEQMALDNNFEIINKIKSQQYDDQLIQWLNNIGATTIGQYSDMCMPTSNGNVVRVREMLSCYSKMIENDDISGTVTSVQGNGILLEDIMQDLSDGIDMNYSIQTALSSFVENQDPASFMSVLQANLGDRFQRVSSYASNVYSVLRSGAGSILDKIQAMVNPLTEFNPKDEPNDMLNISVSTNMYKGASPAAFWLDASCNAIQGLANLYVQSLKISWNITVGIFKGVAAIGAAIWNRFLRGLFITDDISVNEDCNCDYLNIPRSSIIINNDSSYATISDHLNTLFGYTNLSDTDILNSLFKDGYAIDIPLKFGLVRFFKHPNNDNQYCRQIYLTPTSPIKGKLSFIDCGDISGTSSITMSRSINDQFNFLFVENLTESINVTKNDEFYWKAFQTSIARMDFFLGMLANGNLTDSQLNTLTYDNIGSDGFLFGATFTSSTYTNKVYFGPSSNYSPECTLISSNIDSAKTNPSNLDFLNLIANGVIGYSEQSTSGFIFSGSLIATTRSVLAYIYSTSKEGMFKAISQNININPVFVPYEKTGNNNFVFKYVLNSDEDNRNAFNRQLMLTVTTVVVIAASVLIAKGITKFRSNLKAKLATSEWKYCDLATDPNATKEQIAAAKSEYLKTNKIANRLGLLTSASSGINIESNPAGVEQIIGILK